MPHASGGYTEVQSFLFCLLFLNCKALFEKSSKILKETVRHEDRSYKLHNHKQVLTAGSAYEALTHHAHTQTTDKLLQPKIPQVIYRESNLIYGMKCQEMNKAISPCILTRQNTHQVDSWLTTNNLNVTCTCK